MVDLSSPGVAVSVTDESSYAGADRGTIPCIFIATHSNKVHPSGTGIATGTLDTKANTLYLITSQREAIQTFGDPTFYTSNGSPVHGYELNEYGLHALYQYLGIANRAYVIRADIDLGQLAPSAVAPTGKPVNGTYWLDTTNTSWGVFESNGNSNPGLAWENKKVTVVEKESSAYRVVIGSTATPVTSHSTQSVLTTSGIITINGTSISLSTGDTLLSVMTKINDAKIEYIKASLVANAAITGNGGNTSLPNKIGGLNYNLRIVNTLSRSINISGDVAVLMQLGLSNTTSKYIPSLETGSVGDYALITFMNNNALYQKLIPHDVTGVSVSAPDVGAHWYLVGSAEWKAASPTLVTSKVVTTTFTNGYFDIATISGNQRITVNAGDTVSEIYAKINNNSSLTDNGIIAFSTGNQLIISNIYGSNIQFVEQSGNSLDILGINVSTYLGNKLTFSTHAVVPTPSSVGDVWVKTTKPNKGAVWSVKLYYSSTGQWNTINAPLYADDNAATIAMGSSLATGVCYVQYDTEDDGTATHMIRRWNGSSWESLVYEAGSSEPTSAPTNGVLWFNNNLQVDLMVSSGSRWYGYRNYYPGTDIMLSASEPTYKPSGSALVDHDLWIDTSDLENYPMIYRYSSGSWEIIDNTDQTTPFGIVFADARQDDGAGNTDYSSMITSNYVDIDAPDALSYPDGVLLFNTRYSTNNVKKWVENYTFEGRVVGNRWVTVSGNDLDGSPLMGRKAQRIMIVRALAASITDNEDIRSESVYFNLLAAPGYTEVMDELTTLNVDKKQWAFIVGDTPCRLKPNSTEVQRWAQNVDLAGSNGDKGLTSSDPYIGLYYPWGLSTNIDGNEVMIPPSTIALRTMAYNDSVAYMWLAPAGYNRGLVSNATTTGYLTSEDEFKPVLLNQGQRDVLYLNKINPIAYIPNRGLVVYGQKTLNPQSTAMDRINVARLTNYLRYQLEMLAKPFLFEPNDVQTRDSARITFERFLSDLVGLRALYDFMVVCDETNNTNERIDRNELWIDVAIQPVKAVEFIYIPIRIVNTGEEM